MSILDDGPLPTSGRLKTYGDQLPGKFPKYKDGVEDQWSTREATAIRALSVGFSPKAAASKARVSLKRLRGWMGNPYFLMEVTRLTDHNLFRYRAKVLEAVALRAIGGSSQHAKIYLQLTRDLEPQMETKKRGEDEFTKLNPEQMDTALQREYDLSKED